MSLPQDPKRRALMTTLAALPLGASAQVNPQAAQAAQAHKEQRVLVAYFSRTGNTRVVAGLIQRAHGADVFEIRPATPYPEEYLATVEQARKERDNGFQPPLTAVAPNVSQYGTVFLGFPIWGETAPPVIRSFLTTHDLAGKVLIPFVTHGGYGLGKSESVLAAFAPKALLRKGFVMEGEQERRTMDRVTDWLKRVPPITNNPSGARP